MSFRPEDPPARLEPKDAARIDLGFLTGGGETGERMRSLDWKHTPLGPPELWPQSLKSAVSICLNSRFPIALYWGPELALLYNDSWSPILGGKHPWALGRPGRDVWPEIWRDIGPLFERVQASGEGVWQQDQLLPMHRHGYTEECYFNFTFSPIRSEDGGIAGVFNAVIETTFRVIGERRERVLRELAERTSQARSAEHVCDAARQVLERAVTDVPFALLYLLDDNSGHAHLTGSAGAALPKRLRPSSIVLGDPEAVWPLSAQANPAQVTAIGDLSARSGAPLNDDTWPEPPNTAVIVPIAALHEPQAAGYLIAGVSARRAYDAEYRTFFERIGAQLAAAIGTARAYDTERKRAESLAELDKAKTAFFSNVSHEFRTPLTLMLGPIEQATANPATPAPVRAQLELARRNSLRLQKLVNSLLDFSRIEAGRVHASYEPTDLGALTRDLASTFRSAIERAGLRLDVESPSADEPVYVDHEMWEKIVLNLLSNAFKYTLDGAIAVRLRTEGGQAILEVSDSGVGIPPHALAHLFERFYRVEGTAGRTQEGSGIGLALVQELVRLHGGAISVESALGRGTTFRVRLPLGNAHLPPERIRASQSSDSTAIGAEAFIQEALRWIPDRADDSSSSLPALIETPASALDQRFAHTKGARILLADDNADMRAYVSSLLARTYLVEAVADGEQALEAARRQRPDLILSDIMMPRLDGFGLLEALRADERLRNVPVIFLSARAGEESRIEGLDAGADDYLVKPFSARELVARVGALLELTQMRHEHEERLRLALSRLQLALDASQIVGAWDWDIPNDRVYADARFARLYGVELERAAQGAPIAEFMASMHPDDRERTQQTIARAIEAAGDFAAEYRLVQANGSVRWVLAKGRCHHDEHGHPVRFPGVSIDITDRKRAEALQEAQRRALELMVENAPLTQALDTLVHTAEAQSESEMLGSILLADPDGLHLRRGAAPSLPEAYNAAIDGIAIGPNVGSCGTAAFRRSPVYVTDIETDPLWADFRELARSHRLRACWSTPFFSVRGELLGTFAIYYHQPRQPAATDLELVSVATRTAALIIERARAEAALRASEGQLREADRRKDEFLAMLAHELRNPLAPIRNAGELLSRTIAQDGGARLAVEMIKRQATQLTRLVDDLLDVSRITQGRIQLRRRPIDLASVIAQAVETVEPQMRAKQHRLSTVLSSYGPLYVSGDHARLMQCVVNILTNAAKYTDPDGEIRIQSRADGECAVIEITDAGTGIAPELLPKVFELFVQSDRTIDRSQGGLGIGLAVVKRLVEMHGGQVSARSAGLGCGSTFEIRLPRIARPQVSGAESAPITGPPRRVLIVDDNQDAANSLAALLSLHGHQTQVAFSGTEALERIESFHPDVALLDLGLPEMDGYALAGRLRAVPDLNRIRLVALTGYGQAEDRQRTQAAGFDDHLIKPVDLSALERTLAGTSSAQLT